MWMLFPEEVCGAHSLQGWVYVGGGCQELGVLTWRKEERVGQAISDKITPFNVKNVSLFTRKVCGMEDATLIV